MERSFGTTGKGVRVWYFPNSDPSSIPTDLKNGSNTINTDAWTRPNAYFPISKCYNDFSPHNIIFDITLCGDFAGNTYNISGCNLQYPACSYQVGYNGSSFNQSYWEVSPCVSSPKVVAQRMRLIRLRRGRFSGIRRAHKPLRAATRQVPAVAARVRVSNQRTVPLRRCLVARRSL